MLRLTTRLQGVWTLTLHCIANRDGAAAAGRQFLGKGGVGEVYASI